VNVEFEGAISTARQSFSDSFIDRVRAAYRLATSTTSPTESLLWSALAARSASLHAALIDYDVPIEPLRELLVEPGRHHLLFGYDIMFKEEVDLISTNGAVRAGRVLQIKELLAQVSEAMGASRRFNPEFGDDHSHASKDAAAVSTMVAAIEGVTGALRFPNAFPGEHGVLTRAGIASHRAIHAVYGAWRTRELAAEFGSRILEIGPGLGRSAFFARTMGLTDYTIVDLPLTSVAQALFLAHALGEEAVTLTGEEPADGKIAIVTSNFLREMGRSFDLCVNVDSLTEMSLKDARSYAALARDCGAAFLSINHEANKHTAAEVLGTALRRRYRFPYWLRPGYAEELFVAL